MTTVENVIPGKWDCSCFAGFDNVPVIVDAKHCTPALNQLDPPRKPGPDAAQAEPIATNRPLPYGFVYPAFVHMCHCFPKRLNIDRPFLVYLDEEVYHARAVNAGRPNPILKTSKQLGTPQRPSRRVSWNDAAIMVEEVAFYDRTAVETAKKENSDLETDKGDRDDVTDRLFDEKMAADKIAAEEDDEEEEEPDSYENILLDSDDSCSDEEAMEPDFEASLEKYAHMNPLTKARAVSQHVKIVEKPHVENCKDDADIQAKKEKDVMKEEEVPAKARSEEPVAQTEAPAVDEEEDEEARRIREIEMEMQKKMAELAVLQKKRAEKAAQKAVASKDDVVVKVAQSEKDKEEQQVAVKVSLSSDLLLSDDSNIDLFKTDEADKSSGGENILKAEPLDEDEPVQVASAEKTIKFEEPDEEMETSAVKTEEPKDLQDNEETVSTSLGSALSVALNTVEGNFDEMMDDDDGELMIDESATESPAAEPQTVDIRDPMAVLAAFKNPSTSKLPDGFMDIVRKDGKTMKNRRRRIDHVAMTDEDVAALLATCGVDYTPPSRAQSHKPARTPLPVLGLPRDDESTVKAPSPQPELDPIDFVDLSDDEPDRPLALHTKKRRRIRRRGDEDMEDDDNIRERTYEDYVKLGISIEPREFVTTLTDPVLKAKLAAKKKARDVAKEVGRFLPNNAKQTEEKLNKIKFKEASKHELFAQLQETKAKLADALVRKTALTQLKSEVPSNPIQHQLFRSRHPSTASGGKPVIPYCLTSAYQVILIAQGMGFHRHRTFFELPYKGYYFHRHTSDYQWLIDHLNVISGQAKKKEEIDNKQIVIRLVNQKLEKVRREEQERTTGAPSPATVLAPVFYQLEPPQQQPIVAAEQVNNDPGQDQEMINLAEAMTTACDLFEEL